MDYELDMTGMMKVRMVEAIAERTRVQKGWREAEEEMAKGLEKLRGSFDIRRWYDGRELRWVALPKGTAGEPIRITCYRKTEEWLDRSNAMAFYYEGVMACDGCERDRYTEIFMQLGEGRMECTDEGYLG